MRKVKPVNFTNILKVFEALNREFDSCNAISFDNLRDSVIMLDTDVSDAEFDTAIDMLVASNLVYRKFCNDKLESVFPDEAEGKPHLIKTTKWLGLDEYSFQALINL